MLDKKQLEGLSKQELIQLLESHAPTLNEEDIPKKKEVESIPISVFNNDKLSPLETICKYLKENTHKSYSEIATLLNRNDRTIWTTYNNAKKKLPGQFIA